VAPRVLITDHLTGDPRIEREVLSSTGAELVLADGAGEDELASLARQADAILVTYARVGAPVVEAAAAGGCRIIARYGIGYDNVDVEAATRAGIFVTNVPDYCVDEVADHSIALMLSVARGVSAGAEAVRSGRWDVGGPIHRLAGRRLAIIGLGRIGRAVAERARVFGLEVVGHDPYVEDCRDIPVQGAATLAEALADADIVSLHAPLTEQNRHLIGERTLALMRRTPIVVNTARGGLIDLEAALAALDDGGIAALALDVTEVEPLPADHPLRSHPRAVVTPHIGFYSLEAQAELHRRAAEEVERALRGLPPRCPVNAPAPA
jgi:D-3-phosphoglycerate dehydrogenase / 2-oxoglutarate reductase